MNGTSRNAGRQGGNRQRYRDNQGGNPIPQPRPMRYYLDEKKERLDPALVDEKALEWAREFGGKPSSTQMRRFYDEFKAIERKILQGDSLQAKEENLKRDLALIKMFKAKALYAQRRNVASPAFTQFIFDHVASINDLKDFMAFSKIFESVVAFHRFFTKDN